MSSANWLGGTSYAPGALVQPLTFAPRVPVALVNGNFESGSLTGWTVTRVGGSGGTFSVASSRPYQGTYAADWRGAAGSSTGGGTASLWINTAQGPVVPGQSITVRAYIAMDDTGSSQNYGCVRVYWYTSGGALISYKDGNIVSGNFNDYRLSSVTGSAPANAAYACAALWLSANASGGMRADNVTWDHVPPPSTAGLIYKAIQTGVGTSGSTEPTWPTTLGGTVVDGGVTWQAVNTTRVTWQASPIMQSGAVEPTWPTRAGSFVSDGTISWECVSRAIEDANCPQSKVVCIGASKVFASDKDIVRFCATANPLDWSSEQDAGYLPTGLTQANANYIAVLNLYRSNLAALNANGFQLWQLDPDPSAMAIMDQMEGIGSSYPLAAQAVANDLFYLSQLGVRSVGVSAASENLQAGDVGLPVDSLVMPAVAAANGAVIATYYPSAGQYWLAVNGVSTCTVFVFTLNGGKGKWSRYVYPFTVEAFEQLNDLLYLRSGDRLLVVNEAVATDDVAGVATGFAGSVQWGWLDFGQPGTTKMLEGFDIVGSGTPSVSFGYDQSNASTFTAAYQVAADTVPGDIIPFPVSAPSLSVKVDFAPGSAWSLQSMTLYLHDNRPTT